MSNQFLKTLNTNYSSNNMSNANKIALNNNASNNNQNEKPESDKQFLERTHVKSILDALLDTLYKNQPEDPISYICTYFDGLNQQDDLLASALERLKSINFSSPVFDDCVLSLYNILNKIVKSSSNKKGMVKMQIGELYNSTIDSLTSDIQPEIREKFQKLVKKRDYDAISFDILRASLKVTCIFKEYLNQCRNLYKELEIYSNGDKVNKMLAIMLLQQLMHSFEYIPKNNQITIETIYELSPAGLMAALEDKYEKTASKSTSCIGLNEFLLLASQVFFQQVSAATASKDDF